MRSQLLTSAFVCVACCAASLAQTTGYIVPEYLKPQYTAPQDAPASIVIAGTDEPGARMVVTGRTLIGDKPVAGVSLYVFHTDANGKYSTTIYDPRRAEYNPRLQAH
jgi:protocatechuate 3,4-dioxygenase beta subunit